MSRKVILTLIISILLSVPAVAQKNGGKANVYGSLITPTKAPVRGANVLLVQMNGSKVDSTYRVSTHEGLFTFKGIAPGKVYIKATCMGLESADGVFDLTEGDNAVLFTMTYSAERLKEAGITADSKLMWMLGDTTVFNATAVKTMDGDKAIAILQQLPGFEVTGGSIKYRGKSIARTYVNGKQVFGNNASTAFDKLLADEVTQVRVYEEQNAEDARRGLKHTLKDMVLDIKTKNSIMSLADAMAQISGGLDGALSESGKAQGRYYGAVGADFFSEMNNAYAYVGANNIGSSAEGINETHSFNVQRSALGPLHNYQESMDGEFYLSHRWKDVKYGNAIAAGYSLSHTYSRSASRALTEYLQTASSPGRTQADTTSDGSKRLRHDFLLSGEFKDTPLKSISFKLDGTITEADKWGRSASMLSNAGKVMRQDSSIGSENDDVKVVASLSWRHNDLQRIRPSMTLKGSFSNTSTLAWNTDTLASSYVRRNLQSDGIGKAWDARLSGAIDFVLHNDKDFTSHLVARAFTATDRSARRMMTVDILDPSSPVQDMANTYDFTWNNVSAGLEQSYKYTKGQTRISASIEESVISQKDIERLPADASFDHLYFDLHPTFSYSKNLSSLTISGSASIPSIEQTRNRISDANPLVLSGGNPDLKQQYTITGTWLDNIFLNQKTGYSMGYSLNALYSFDPIVTRTYYFTENTPLSAYNGYVARQGAILNTFENATSPAWSLSGGLSMSKRTQKIKLSSSLKLSASLDGRPQYLRDALVHMRTKRFGAHLTEIFNPNRNFMLNMGLNCTYHGSSSDAAGTISSAIVTELDASLRYVIAKNTIFTASENAIYDHYLAGAGANHFYVPMRIELARNFPAKGLIASIGIYDLLSKGSSYTTTTAADYYHQQWTPSYGRYLMVHLYYEFRKTNPRLRR